MLFQFLTLLLFTYYGMMAVSVSPSVQMAAVISSAFYSIWFLFTGKHPGCSSLPAKQLHRVLPAVGKLPLERHLLWKERSSRLARPLSFQQRL